METRDHSKNGASLKSQMSRKNYFIKQIYLLIFLSIVFIQTDVLGQNIVPPTGKSCMVQLSGNIKSNNESNDVYGFVVGDIYNNDNQLSIKNGTPVLLSVNTQKAKGMGKPGKIEISTISTFDINGNNVSLIGSYSKEGESKNDVALGLGLGLGLTVLCPFGFFFFCIKGEDVTLPSNIIIQAVVR